MILPRKRQLSACLAVLVALFQTSVLADPLQQHRWSERVLVLAAPSTTDTDLKQQQAQLRLRQAALLDRDLSVYQLIGEQGTKDGTALPPERSRHLRDALNIATTDRVLLLIGLDGSEKRRAPLTTALSELFALIDQMPMRQADIRAKRAAGLPITQP